jgi:transcriptional regulator with XRE-family HTH domain
MELLMATINVYEQIGYNIRQKRKKLGLTQGELSCKVFMSRPSIVLLESGKQKTTIENIYRFAEVLDCNVSDIFPSYYRIQEQEESIIDSVINTIGGKVEGKPISALNFLQRIRILVSKEKKLNRMVEALKGL